mgnify:CR=1 FL=1
MAFFGRNNEGYSRGGLDVESAVNLFFKGVLLFPVFLFAGYIGLAMMKHVIFHGIPSMTAPTRQQQERIHERNEQIGVRDESPKEVSESRSPEVISLPSPVIDEEAARHHVATVNYRQAVVDHREAYRVWSNCVSGGRRMCQEPGQSPSFSTYYDVNYER